MKRKGRNMTIQTKKLLIAIVALLILITGTIGATLAWLTDETAAVKNTFTVGDVNITLTEEAGGTSKEFKMVPGTTITKDPKVTVLANSEPCWLFIEVTESSNLNYFITYGIRLGTDGWSELDGHDNVYYREVDASIENQEFFILTNNTVTINQSVTKADMEGLTQDTLPTLTFKAYAVQKAEVNTVAEAWAIAKPTP